MSIDVANSAAQKAGQQVHDAVLNFLGNTMSVGLGARTIAAIAGALVAASVSFVVAIFGAVFQVAGEVVALFLEAIGDVKSNNQDTLNSVTASALSEVLGVEVSASDLPSSGGTTGQIQAMRAVGARVIQTLLDEMGATGISSPGPGQQAAQAFMGFGLNFATASALFSVVTEAASLGFLKEFAEFGEQTREVLGIGRLMRQAFHPFINTLITLPFTREMNAQYRPHRLSVEQYVSALNAGRIQQAQVQQALAEAGFPDDLVSELIVQHSPKFHAHQIDVLIRWGKLSLDEGIQTLVSQGMNADAARIELDSLHLAEADKQEKAYADEILSLAKQRQLDSDVFSTLIQRLHLSDEEKQGYLNRVGVWLDTPHKRLTLQEIIFLTEHNLITGDEIDTWAAAEGYSANDQAALSLYATQKELDFETAQKAKAAKAAAAAAKHKGTVPPPKG